jgi:predicted ribosome quality control (RQC) complex YloA/Tae2 family protein
MMLSLLARELQGELAGARVDKVLQPTREEVILVLRGQSARFIFF